MEQSEHKLGQKFDTDKSRWDLLDYNFIEDLARVLTFGAKKYAPNSWQYVQDAENRYFAAAMRHLTAYRRGQTIDDETGISHLVHAACNLMFLFAFNKETEDVGFKQLECERKTNKRCYTKKCRK